MRSRERCVRLAVVGLLVAIGTGVSAVSTGGCSSPDTGARVDPIGPSLEQFVYVAPVLSRRCGSIDCHGSTFRNLRVYGYGGLRLGNAASPDVPAFLTPEEVNATYESVLGLEPEIMRDVVKSGGTNPERLTFVRKGRGDEEHKGHRRVTPGDDSDRCITSWLAGAANVDACKLGGCYLNPAPSPGPSDGGTADAASAPQADSGVVFPITSCP